MLLCRPLPHQDRDSRYHFGEESLHFIWFLAALVDLIWTNDPYADKRYDSIFVRLAASELYHLHLRSVWWMILDISPARKILKEGGFPIYFTFIHTIQYMCVYYICRSSTILWWQHRTHLKLTHTSKSVWNILYFRPFCMALGPEEMVIVWIANSLICFKTCCIKKITFLMSIHNLGFRILVFYHRVQWRGAKTGGKECWGPCHGLIPSLWDFARSCSLQIERWHRNWRGTSYRFREGVHWAVHFGSH